MGGRGGSSGGNAGFVASGGRGIEINLLDGAPGGRRGSVKSYSGGTGLVESYDIGVGVKMDRAQYDAFVPLRAVATKNDGSVVHNGRTSAATVYMGIKLNTPKGVSEKQINYAKSQMGKELSGIAERFTGRVNGSIDSLNRSLLQPLKQFPALTAEQMLDRRKRPRMG